MLRIVLASGAFPIISMKRAEDVVESSLTSDPLQDLAQVLDQVSARLTRP